MFLISLKAGGTGLNLTGADLVIHYDPWWNPTAEEQATGRAHRIGQTKKVEVLRLVVHHSIEEQVLRMSDRKLDLAQEAPSFQLGSRVTHAVFGEGTITGFDADRNAYEVQFDGMETPRSMQPRALHPAK